jgi:hypothetical protein
VAQARSVFAKSFPYQDLPMARHRKSPQSCYGIMTRNRTTQMGVMTGMIKKLQVPLETARRSITFNHRNVLG